MRKNTTLPIMLLLLLLCGCNANGGENLNSQTRFLLDTAVTLSADCDNETLSGAFKLCEELEKTLSRTAAGSDVYRLNNSQGPVTVSDDTRFLTERAIYFSDISGGKFDITICPVSELWDFKNQVIPDRDEIAEALKNVDYHSLAVKGNEISANGKKLDLGAVAKGYIADKLYDYFKENGVTRAIINLGGNVKTLGEFTVGIKKPFENTTVAAVKLKDKSAATSGIYERYIEKNGKIYHHILDPETGYGVENELASVTVIGDNSCDCDALSTVCMLVGTEKSAEILKDNNAEAVFIGRDGKITLTSGLYRENDKIYFKQR